MTTYELNILVDTVFTNNRISSISNSSGTITGYTVYHHITDHLGSVRAITNASTGNVVETSDFLPFGTRWNQTAGSSSSTLTDASNRWRYSGKEEQKALNSYLPLIDYGARMYDPTIARWMSVDPMAEKYYPLSPYNYCLGNPIILVDPQGDTLKINDFSIIEAIYHGLEDDKSIHLRLNNGIVDPKSLESNNDDFFLNDLKELAESSVMVELSVADSYSFITDSGKDSRAFESAPFDNIDVPEIYNYCIQNNLPFGRSINGNTGRTLFPSLSKERSTNTSIQIIINSKGNLNHRTVGLAHELGHAILYVRGKPYQHGDPGVDTFIYKQRATPMSIRLGYDY